ncbi:TPA: phage tail protein, partial [Staphylococcus pseudintermedius]|nr:phage tail protein [Staphylococcus pseudintermedius]
MAENTDEFKIKAIFEAVVSKFEKQIDSALKKVEEFERLTGNMSSVKLDADNIEVLEKVDEAKAKVEKFDNTNADAKLDVDDKVADTKIERAKRNLNILNNKRVKPIIDTADKLITTKIERVKRALQFLNNKTVKPVVDMSDKLMFSKLRRVKAELQRIKHEKVNISLNFKDTVAATKIRAFKLRLKSIPNRIKSKFMVDIDNKKTNIFALALSKINDRSDAFSQRMDALAKSIRTFGTVGQYVLRGIMISSFSALIPVIASAIPVVMAVGNALGVVAGGALGLAGAFSVAGAGLVGFGLMAKTATKMLDDGLIRSKDSTNAYRQSLKGVKKTWADIVKMNDDAIFGSMASALYGLQTALKSLKPFISGVSSAIDDNLYKFEEWVSSSKTAKKAFEAMNKTGVKIFSNLLSAVGRFGDGLVNIFTQFMPLFQWASEGFNNMGKSFQKWANKVSTEKGIQRFIAYTEKNLPVIGKIFGDTFLAIINLFRAFSGNSQDLFKTLSEMTGRFKAWSESVGKSKAFNDFLNYLKTNGPVVASLIGNVIGALLKFVEAMAPIGAVVLQVINTIVQFISNLFEAHPVIAQIIGVLMSLFGVMMSLYPAIEGVVLAVSTVAVVLGLLAGPIGVVVAIIAVLIASFVYLWQTNETFRNKVMEVWNNIVSLITDAINIVWEFVMNVFGTLVSWWNENHDLILQTAKTIWEYIGDTVMTAIDVIVSVLSSGFDIVVSVVEAVWSVVSTIISTAIDLVLDIITLAMQIITGDWSGAWETIKSIGYTFIMGIVDIISSIFSGLISILGSILNLIVSVVVGAFKYIWSFISMIISILLSIWSVGWNALKTVVLIVWDWIKS